MVLLWHDHRPRRPCYVNSMAAGEAFDLQKLLDPVLQCLDESSARRLAELKLPEHLQARVDFLADRADAGAITEDEASEYDALVRFTTLIDILRLKARGNATHRAAG